MSFQILTPGRTLFGRGVSEQAAPAALQYGSRGIVVHGASPARASFALRDLPGALALACPGEPDLPLLEAALGTARDHRPDWVMSIGGGAAIDLGKALAALVPQPTGPLDHLEGAGPALPLTRAPLPFIALPTTAGTGAEATKNAVIGLPGRKVSLRDDRMVPRLACVDPTLTDHCPHSITLASGLDAITQVIEPYLSHRANTFTDALCLPAIRDGLPALMRLMRGEDASARDTMAFVSLSGGMALANAGLGAVHGFAGVVGGMTGLPHGAICGALLPHVLAMNRARMPDPGRAEQVCAMLAAVLGTTMDQAPQALADWARDAGLPPLPSLDPATVIRAARAASSMKANPVALTDDDLLAILQAAR